MNHTIVRLKQVVECAEGSDRLPRHLHFFETVAASLAWPALAVSLDGGRCPRDLTAVRDFRKPTFGSHVNWLEEILRPPSDQPYLQLLRECLRDRKHGDADLLPIRPIARRVGELLDLPAPGKTLSLLTFIQIMGTLRNQMAHPTTPLPVTTADALVDEFQRRSLLDHLLDYFSMLSGFPLAYVKASADGDERNVVICGGDKPLGAELRTLSVGDALREGHLYLLDLRAPDRVLVAAEVSPFMLVRKSAFTMENQLFFLAEVQAKAEGYRHVYCTYLDREQHEESSGAGASPLQARLAAALEATRERKPARPSALPTSAVGTPDAALPSGPPSRSDDTGSIRVRVFPPVAGVSVAFLDSREDPPLELSEVPTLDGGATALVPVPAGKVDIRATWTRQEAQQTTEVRVFRHGIPVREAVEQTVILGLPYTPEFAGEQIAWMEKRWKALAWLRSRWARVTAAVAGILLASLLGARVTHHVAWVPDGQVYVPPSAFEVGLVSSAATTDRTHKMLAIVSSVANEGDIDVGKLISLIATSPPREVELGSFYVEPHEVSVKRYAEFYDSLEGTPEAKKKMEPADWETQVVNARSGKDWRNPSIPVVNVSLVQAEAFCEFVTNRLKTQTKARLLTSDEWEVIARNMQPGDFEQWTIYPWGDDFYPGMAVTQELGFAKLPHALSENIDQAKARRIWGLGGNVSEWTSTTRGDGKYTVRGACFSDLGRICSMGHITTDWGGRSVSDKEWAFRLAYDANPGLDDFQCVFVPGGRFRLGYPQHALFRLISALGADAKYILTLPEKHEMVGDFRIMTRKVTQGEYREFLAKTRGSGRPRDRQRTGPPDRDVLLEGRDADPLLGISWQEAYAYCRWRGGRLPMAEEWERIGRGTAETPGRVFPWGGFVSAQKAEEDLQAFLHQKPETDSARLVRSMWSDGPEWTSTTVLGDEGKQLRILKGLPPKGLVEFDTRDLKNQSGYLSYLTTFRVPADPSQRVPGAGFRVVFDVSESWPERIGLRPGFKRHTLADNPPK